MQEPKETRRTNGLGQATEEEEDIVPDTHQSEEEEMRGRRDEGTKSDSGTEGPNKEGAISTQCHAPPI